MEQTGAISASKIKTKSESSPSISPKRNSPMEMPELPQMFKGESLTRLLQGIAFGAVATAVLGFSQGFVMLSSSAEEMASERATAAVVAVYAPTCVDRFNVDATPEQREGFDKASWQKDDYIEKTGFATPQGAAEPNGAVADKCAELITAALEAAVKKAEAKK
jgi:hypothetical protein